MSSPEMLQLLFILLGALLLMWVIFMLTREFWCWYWKINERLGSLQEIKATLENLEQKLATAPAPSASGQAIEKQPRTHCYKCERPLPTGERFCPCGADNG